MLQSLSLKLVTSKKDDDLLIGTMTEYNKACNWVADKIFGLRVSKFQLQKMLYYDVKSLFNLPSQSVIRLIAKVVEAYKRDIKIKPVFRELGAIQYDERNSSIGLDKISLTTFRDKKRLALKTSVGEYQKEVVPLQGKPPVSQSGVVRHPKHAGETCEPAQNSEGFFAHRRGHWFMTDGSSHQSDTAVNY
jgi:predicted transposase